MSKNHQSIRWFIFAIVVAACCPPARAEDSPKHSAVSILNTIDGDFYTGALQDCPTTNVIRWQSPGVTQPFDFPADIIRAAYFAAPGKRPVAEGDYCCELTDGDLLFGSLLGITPEQVEMESPQFGRIRIARAEVRRLTAWGGSSAFVYRGPNGLDEWKPEGKSKWREEAGRIISSERGASIHTVVAIPKQAHFEFEISWTKTPQFTLTICSNQKKDQQDEGFRFEVWGQNLVLVREVKGEADVAVIGQLDRTTNRVHLEAFYDFPTGEFTVQAVNGQQLAKVKLLRKGGTPPRCIRLINGGTEVCLEQLSVSQWNGHLPTQEGADKPRVHKSDGTIVYGDVVEYQADTKQFVVHTKAASGEPTDDRLDGSQVTCIVLTPDEATDQETKPIAAKAIRVGLLDGSRCSGELAKVEDGKVYLQRVGIDAPLTCSVANVRSIVSLNRRSQAPPLSQQRIGRLELDGLSSHGSLDEATAADAKTSCLVWRPRGSLAGSPLVHDVAGRIVYRDPPPAPSRNLFQQQRLQQRQPPRPVGFVGAVARVFTGEASVPQPPKPSGPATICLLVGDRIPCEAPLIDEEGVHFSSSVVASHSVPHRDVKALELVPNWTAKALAEEKRLRLLTLPRMQKGNPPTHLIVSTNGDFLRGRLLSLTAETLEVETRLEKKQISRNRVACIIWLNDEQQSESPAKPAEQPPVAMLVQAVRADGVRLTFVPHECSKGETLVGASDLLGKCQVDLKAVDQLIIGAMIKAAAKELTYGAWKLSDAIEPQFAKETTGDGTGDGTPKVESSLISKPAPDFQLELLDGKAFKLSEHKGHIVVLDFWASWCGPCMQAMPQVDEVLKEFAEKGVELVAVNMQEDSAAITGALERLKISPAVALDIDGAVAERYQVSAIPQTVVVDAEGNVAELFIGANPGFANQLRTTIQGLLSPQQQPQPPDPKK